MTPFLGGVPLRRLRKRPKGGGGSRKVPWKIKRGKSATLQYKGTTSMGGRPLLRMMIWTATPISRVTFAAEDDSVPFMLTALIRSTRMRKFQMPLGPRRGELREPCVAVAAGVSHFWLNYGLFACRVKKNDFQLWTNFSLFFKEKFKSSTFQKTQSCLSQSFIDWTRRI